MSYKLSYRLFWVGFAITVVLFLAAAIAEKLWLMYAGIGVYVVAGIQKFYFVRCPDCGYNLDPRYGFAKFCPGCGTPLEW